MYNTLNWNLGIQIRQGAQPFRIKTHILAGHTSNNNMFCAQDGLHFLGGHCRVLPMRRNEKQGLGWSSNVSRFVIDVELFNIFHKVLEACEVCLKLEGIMETILE